ncbi:alpha/beta fold hydrolase [Mangrovihabitans endophyticus]|nr:alpha/beta hydrolase [Mangrovihabitans endophyticus]
MPASVLSRPGADLSYHETGAGPLLGYSHGIFFSSATEDAIGVFPWSQLAGTRRIVRYDQRAHGRSTGQPDPDAYVWPSLAGDLLAMANHVGGAEPLDWAGSSMGTASLLWAATQRPARFRRLVLIIPPTVRETRVAAAQTYRAGADMVQRRGKAAWMAAVRAFPPPAVFADLPTWRFDADVPEELLPALLRGAAASDLPDDDALRAITQPVLILAWETDPVHPVSSARLLADTLPDARLHVSDTVADIRAWPNRIESFLAEAL